MSRLVTGLTLLAVAFYLVFVAPQPVFVAGAICMSFLCYREFAGIVEAHNIGRPGPLGVVIGLLLLFWPYVAHFGIDLLAGVTLLIALALISGFRYPDPRRVLPQAACILFGAFYTFAPWRFAIDLRAESVHLLFFALALNWAGDTLAYYIGRRFGKHKLAPLMSPKKSWEGTIASIFGSAIFGILYLHYALPFLPFWQALLMSIAGNIAGQFGDLAESAMKRGAGVKDSGNLLPGHGGMLDRVDSSLFALPVVYSLHSFFR